MRLRGARSLSPVGVLVALGVVVAVTALAPGAGAVSTSLVINEVDYDQPSTDDAEFLELRNISRTTDACGNSTTENATVAVPVRG
jgi:hypothetical protein